MLQGGLLQTPVWSGSPWEFWLSGAAGTKADAAIIAGRLGDSTMACEGCGDSQ